MQLGTDPKAKRGPSTTDSIIKAQFKGATELWTDQARNSLLNSLFENWSQIDHQAGSLKSLVSSVDLVQIQAEILEWPKKQFNIEKLQGLKSDNPRNLQFHSDCQKEEILIDMMACPNTIVVLT